ncbi:hypothetical protein [Cecembia rubra]|uniref:SatD family protein n=1 Tax=Cecembia rubra TaxID=1485585 RepID=A0A2P8EAV0_9BACT|nr:hypothetical protein [Cecembia rubra]PSL06580.1 hypothetical protein CLV48_102397 [Cecembia rubra]
MIFLYIEFFNDITGMLAVITGDIINSRKLENPKEWLFPIKNLFSSIGEEKKTWEIFRGDSFQIEIKDPMDALLVALKVKATIKSISDKDKSIRQSPVDVRMAIGIGEGSIGGTNIGEKVGSAYIRSGEAFESLKRNSSNLLLNSGWPNLDRDFNFTLKFALILMDNWTISSAETIKIILECPELKQVELAKILGIEQNSVSGRIQRGFLGEILELERFFRLKLKEQML